ncbi:hypothetical protein F4820DRAFT_403072 [Hypoxylon rubiginosum]|uniref:Uncharacterized protein n=1 Tax=Hypoxylon rubiginosum TaxID=110542 RepID=A0ACB9ZIG7_9PEZI|nr:hypothetical protein F4820DRAFT_403072 [Hypoxylon rubiginosum]
MNHWMLLIASKLCVINVCVPTELVDRALQQLIDGPIHNRTCEVLVQCISHLSRLQDASMIAAIELGMTPIFIA